MTETAEPKQRFGRCLNQGYCALADSNAHIPLAEGAPMSCPQCGRDIVLRPAAGAPLVATGEERRPVPRRLVLFGSALAAAIGFGAYFGLFTPPPEPEKAAEEEAEEYVPAPIETVEAPDPGPARANVMLFTLGATPETHQSLAPALVLAFMASKNCVPNAQKQMPNGSTRFSCDKRSYRFFVDIAPTTAAEAFNLRLGRKIDLVVTSEAEASDKPRDTTVIGYNPAAIVVHPANPLRGLSLAQAAEVFKGNARRFSDIGGAATPLSSFAGPDSNRDVQLFRTLALGGAALGSGTRRLADSAAVGAAVAGDPAGIGLVGLNDIAGTKPLAINGVAPVPDSISGGKYPLSLPLKVDVPTGSKIRFAAPFAWFAATADGQRAVRAAGFTPLPESAVRTGTMPLKGSDPGE